MRAGLIALIAIIVGVLILINTSLFVLNPTQQALILQFGQVRRAVTEPGLYFKIPFVQNVLFLDKRILDLDVPAQEIIAEDQKRLVVDAFARYKISNPVLFYQSVNNIAEGASRLSTFMQSALRAVLADASFTEIVRDDRPELMDRIRREVQSRADSLGIQVVDVRIRRADLPEANSQAIFRRMQTERQQEATEIRAEGEEAAQRIRANADRQATVIVAEANREAEQVRGQGDAQRSSIFAEAYNRDPGFFAFYRSMQAYESSMHSDDTRMVISPQSEFFRYFISPTGGQDPRGLPDPRQAQSLPSLGTPTPPANVPAVQPGSSGGPSANDNGAAATPAPSGPLESGSAAGDSSSLDSTVEDEVRAVEEQAERETEAAEQQSDSSAAGTGNDASGGSTSGSSSGASGSSGNAGGTSSNDNASPSSDTGGNASSGSSDDTNTQAPAAAQ
ncbi:membrane protease subunit HflC [Amorphus orientalis]|uniref:Membrane protease subunit HflC n=1 Tax=Amorphus orientalis TaxID=649198 RepID=A0AAE3VNM2_9HYPH|nr:protease modulator HflC [Amorphus orientalis]MDQ0315290.1 membrane protease subunit HflC [Amorphus orientalis]